MAFPFQQMGAFCFGVYLSNLTLSFSPVHTYIIGHYNPSVRIIDLVSHATYVVCVNFIHQWRDLQFKVDSERQIFWETFHRNFYLLSEFLPEICWEEIAEEILFIFRFDVWPGARTLAFHLISQHTTYLTRATYILHKFPPQWYFLLSKWEYFALEYI